MSVNIKGIIKGSLVSVGITLIIILILSVIAYLTRISENAVTIGAYAAVIVGIFVGSLMLAGSSVNKKFLHIMLMCAVYAAVLFAVSAAVNGRIMFNVHTAAVLGGMFAASFLGLIIGNNR